MIDAEPGGVRHRCEGECGADAGGRDHVVPARVADPGQRVVLGAQRDGELARAVNSLERGGDAVGADLHREPGVGEHVGDPRHRAMLVPRQLRVRVDGVAELDQLSATRFDLGFGPRLELCGVGRCLVCHGIPSLH